MTNETIQPFLNWISAHPNWSGFIVFLISLSESLAIVGLLVPGVVMMTAIGGMMGAGILPFYETLLWAILGAIAGDGISYWLGYHYHERLRNYWPFKQFPGLLARGEAFFRSHGGKSIIFGRFVGPVRPMIPVIAGMMDMTPKRFLVFNILSAIVWAPLYSLPGILVGLSLGSLSTEEAGRVGFLILLLLLVLWLLYEFILTIGKWIATLIQGMLRKIWRIIQTSKQFTWLHNVLYAKTGSEEGQLGIALLFILALAGFVSVFFDALYSEGIDAWNEPVYQALRALNEDKWIDAFAFLTGLGDPKVLLPAVVVSGLWLLWRLRFKTLACWWGTIGLGYLSGVLVKAYVKMPRPEGLLYLIDEYSFPSHHVLASTLTYGLAAALMHLSLAPNHRFIPWLFSVPLILLISVSRLYLGVHWFTDVIGGLTLGIAFVTFGLFFYKRVASSPVPIRGILIPGVLMIFIMMIVFAVMWYPKQRQESVRQWPIETLTEHDWWQGTSQTNELYRTGALKRQATIFDVQWLGTLPAVRAFLKKTGWQEIPQLNFNSSLLMLADHPSPFSFPVLPKFHRDRLPVLTVAKEINPTKRMVIQLWRSDFLSEKNVPLWVGTLRVESVAHPLPFVTLYLENPNQDEILNALKEDLNKNKDKNTKFSYKEFKGHQTIPTILLIDFSKSSGK